jgi:hypothetical protein
MAPPVRVAGRVTGPEPIQAVQAGIRATQYVNPYIRAGWDNWKLALAEAEMWAKQDASEYDAKLKQYEVLYDLRKQLEGDLAKLQLEAEKAGAEAAKVVFQEGQDAALANASATNTASKLLFEQTELNKRATADNVLSRYTAELSQAGMDKRLAFSEAAATNRFNINEQNQTANAGVAGRSGRPTSLGDYQNPQIFASSYSAYDPTNPASLNNVIDSYRSQVDASRAAGVPKDEGAIVSDVARLVQALQASPNGATVDPTLLTPENQDLVINGLGFNSEGGPRNMSYNTWKSGGTKGPAAQAPMPGGLGPSNVARPGVGIAAPTEGPAVERVGVGTLEKPDFTAAQFELEKKLVGLERQLSAIDLTAPERTSLIDQARKIYGEKFRGFPGAIREPQKPPVQTDRWASTKLAAAKRAKELEGLYRTDASDPLNKKALDNVIGSLNSSVTSTIDQLFAQRTPKTDPNVIPSSIMKLYSSDPGVLEDAMTYYIYKKKREDQKNVISSPSTVQPEVSPVRPPQTVGTSPVYMVPKPPGQ